LPTHVLFKLICNRIIIDFVFISNEIGDGSRFAWKVNERKSIIITVNIKINHSTSSCLRGKTRFIIILS